MKYHQIYSSIICFLFILLPSNLVAQTCVDPDGDGWGWNGTTSCRLNTVITPGPCVDPDGDGWGWNGVTSCRISPASNPGNNTPSTGDCIDTDGDGWGWNGVASCIPNGGAVNNPSPQAPRPQEPSQGACEREASGTFFRSSSSPLNSTGNSFYPNDGPQCVIPSNQFNGPGLSWGDFRFINNAWNGQQSTWDWSQCIVVRNNGGNYYGALLYDWGDEYALPPGVQEWEVKSFPEIIFGTKEQGVSSGGCDETGLPAPYNELPEFTINYEYDSLQTQNRVGTLGGSSSRGGDRNIAIESFFHSSCDIRRGGNSNVEFELMVWLSRGPERLPSGDAPRGTYTDNYGVVYDVYTKPRSDPGYIAYVARNQPTSGSLNWNEFINDAKANASFYGIKTLQDNWCLGNIIMGSEIWWGEGSVDFKKFEIEREY